MAGWTAGHSLHGQAVAGPAVVFPPPPSSKTYWGAWSAVVSGDSPHDTSGAITRLNTTLGAPNPGTPGAAGNIMVARTYDLNSVGISNLEAQLALSGLGVIPQIASFQQNGTMTHAAIAAGTYDSAINGLCNYISTAINGNANAWVDLAYCHEWDHKVLGTPQVYTFADYSPAAQRVANIITAHGDPLLKPCTIWVGASNSFASRVSTYWPTLSTFGYTSFGIDPYQGFDGLGHDETATSAIDPQYQTLLGLTSSGGAMDFLIPETGVDSIGSGDTEAQRTAWTQSLVDYCPGKFKAITWFDSGDTVFEGHPNSAAIYEAAILAAS
jgi:hypothetical protein